MTKLLSDKRKWEGKKIFLLALPAIVLVFIFNYLPLWGWSFAFFHYRPGRSIFNSEFAGLAYFRFLFGNEVMRRNLFNVLRNTIGIQMLGYLFSPLPMLFAAFLSEMHSSKFKRIVQSLTTLPHFISWVIIFSLMNSFFAQNGMVTVLLREAGLVAGNFNLMTSPDNVWIRMVLLQQWKGLGWSAIIYFAAIAGINPELYEAAKVDGANTLQRLRYITLPLLLPTYFVLLVISIGHFLNSGIEQYLAFANAINRDSIEVLDLYVYNMGIGSQQISFSVAVGMMKSTVALLLFGMANLASKKIRGSSIF